MTSHPIGPGSRSTVNARLMSDLIRSRVQLAKIEGRMIRREFMPVLRELRREILLALEELPGDVSLDEIGQARINALVGRVATFLQTAQQQLLTGGAAALGDVASREARIQMGLAVRSTPATLARDIFTASPTSSIGTIANATTEEILGPFSQRWAASTLRTVQGELTQAVAMGEDMRQAARRLERATQMAASKAMTMARTGIQSAANRTANEFHSRNRNAFKGVIRVETLDLRTCTVCIPLDGTRWSFEPDPEADGTYEERPPDILHPNCRGFFIPWTRSWRDLGVDMDELEPMERASMDGEVPGNVNAMEWLEGRPDNEIRSVLGPTLFPLYQQGKVSLGDLISGFQRRSVGEIVATFG